jgi:cysteine desulfuration protein SufE
VTINDRAQEVVSTLNGFDDWEDRYREIIQWGKKLPALEEEFKTEDYKVKGCQSQVWVVPGFDGGVITFKADSDAAIVRGIIALFVYVYSGSTPGEILGFKPTFVDDIGLRQHLSMSRANGLNSMLKKIMIYAMAFQAKAGL